jgi:hypothetical protein
MKRPVWAFALVIVLCTLGGCGNARRGTSIPPSAFLEGFSIGSIIEANESYLIAKQTVSSGMLSEPPVSFYQKHEIATVQIDPIRIEGFVEAVRSDIEQALMRTGAEITGLGGDHPEEIEQALIRSGVNLPRRGTDRPGPEESPDDLKAFSFRYSEDQADGVINVWGVRGPGTSFKLIVLITES